ncbi:hypothetical protein ACVT3M_001570 [Campylobacter jejuni]
MAFSWAFYCCDYGSDFTSNAFLGAVCMIAIAIVALSGITTTQLKI